MNLLKKFVGIDVGRSSIFCCVLSEEPKDLADFAQSYKPIVLKPTHEDTQKLLSLGDVFILEPTGADYWLWLDLLNSNGVEYRLVSGTRVRNFARTNEIMSKGDREDAAAIACYGLINLIKGKESAFLSVIHSDLKQHWNTLKTMPKISNQYINKIRSRLVFEAPHLAEVEISDRPWAEEKPAALWRELAGLPVSSRGRKRAEPDQKIGRSVGWVTSELSKILCAQEALQARIEQAIDQEVQKDDSRSMQCLNALFCQWGIPDRTAIVIISAVHPLDQFLSEDGKRIRRRKWNSKGTKRNGQDKSMKAFQRAMAYGQIKVQSGEKFIQVSTGDPYVQNAIKNFLIMKCVVSRQPNRLRLFKVFGKPPEWDAWKKSQHDAWIKAHSFKIVHQPFGSEPWKNSDAIASVAAYNGSTARFALLQLFYEFAPQCQNLGKWKRIGKVYSLFVRLLFSDAVSIFQQLKN